MKCGILPRVLEHRLGKPAYNFGLPGCPAPYSYFLLRRAIDAGARPSAVVVDYIPYLLAPDSWHASALRIDGASTREYLDLSRATHDPDLFTSCMMGRALPSLRSRLEIREAIVGVVSGTENKNRANLRVFLRNWRINHGAHMFATTGDGKLSAAELLERIWLDQPILYPDTWSIDPLNERFVRRFMALAQAHEIPVYWLLPPMRRGVQEAREEKGIEETYIHFVRSICADFPNLTVVDARCSQYLDSAFADSMHLDPDSAVVLTEALARVLKRRQQPAPAAKATLVSWVPLPIYQPQSRPVPVEDMSQSRIAVQGSQGRRMQ